MRFDTLTDILSLRFTVRPVHKKKGGNSPLKNVTTKWELLRVQSYC